jgi:hypothetical protein
MKEEYCLVTNYNETFKTCTVLNMCMSYKPGPPELTDYQREQGWQWVPVQKVANSSLTTYRFWNERP